MAEEEPSAEPIPSKPYAGPGPDFREQARRNAELMARLHQMLATLDAARAELLPGESQAEFHDAWVEFSNVLHDETKKLYGASTNVLLDEKPDDPHGVYGATGDMKRNMLQRGIDEVFRWFSPEPRDQDARIKTCQATARVLDLGGTFAQSAMAASPAAAGVVEFFTFGKHLFKVGIATRPLGK